jgi:hypothetical protein
MGFNTTTQGRTLAGESIIDDPNSDNGAPVVRTSTLAMTSATGAGGALSWQNPTGGRIIVHSLIIDITTASGATTTIDCGVASGATTTSDDLIDGKTVATAAVIHSIHHYGTNGSASRAVPADYYVTGSITGTIGSFAATAYISWTPASV